MSNLIDRTPKDLVTHIGYDAYGRQDKDWLPYQATGVLGSYRSTDPAGATQTYYQTHYPDDIDINDQNDIFYGVDGVVEILNIESNEILILSKRKKITSSDDGTILSEEINEKDLSGLTKEALLNFWQNEWLSLQKQNSLDLVLSQNGKKVNLKIHKIDINS